MGGQAWLADILAGVMLATTVYCVARIVVTRMQRRPAEHDIDAVHALMGVAMAGMLVASLHTLPNDVWAALFGVAAAYYAWLIGVGIRASRTGQAPAAAAASADGQRPPQAGPHRHLHLPHLAMCLAMVYMLLAVPAAMSLAGHGGMSMGGSSGARFPLLALLLTLILAGFVILDTDRLSRLRSVAVAQARPIRVEAALALARAGVTADLGPGYLAGATETPAAGPAAQPPASPAGRTAGPVAPGLALCCQIAMGATMAYMLVLML